MGKKPATGKKPAAAKQPPAIKQRVSAVRTSAGRKATVKLESMRVAVVEESIHVGKRLVDTGRVRLRKLVHEDHVTVDEPLTIQTVEIERVAIGRPVEGPVAVRHEGEVMIVSVVEERLIVSKQLVLVEEIRITRRTLDQRAPRNVAVRREEIIAERLDPASGEWKEERTQHKS